MKTKSVKLPVVYNYYEAKKNAESAFNNSVRALRDMLYLLFTAEGIDLPDGPLNDSGEWHNMAWLGNCHKRFYLTTGEKEEDTRFVATVSAMGKISYAVESCEKKTAGQLNIPWRTKLGTDQSSIKEENYMNTEQFTVILPEIIEAMRVPVLPI